MRVCCVNPSIHIPGTADLEVCRKKVVLACRVGFCPLCAGPHTQCMGSPSTARTSLLYTPHRRRTIVWHNRVGLPKNGGNERCGLCYCTYGWCCVCVVDRKGCPRTWLVWRPPTKKCWVSLENAENGGSKGAVLGAHTFPHALGHNSSLDWNCCCVEESNCLIETQRCGAIMVVSYSR